MACELTFRVTCSETQPGQHLRIVGSCAHFGEWDTERGLVVVTSADAFPMWTLPGGACILLGTDQAEVIEYKYVICDTAGSAILWEETANRLLRPCALAGAGALAIAEAFGSLASCDAKGRFLPLSGTRPSDASGAPVLGHQPHQEDEEEVLWSRRARLPLRGPEAPSPATCPRLPSKGKSWPRPGAQDGSPSGVSRRTAADVATGVSAAFRQHYELLGDAPLGEGSFGLVWRCQPSTGGSPCAVKVVPREAQQEEGGFMGDNCEIETHAALRHPNVVNLLEYFAEEHAVMLVMELCLGGSLFEAVTRQAQDAQQGFTSTQAAVPVQHTLAAVAYLHRLCILHRDVKLENVLLLHAGVPLEENVFKLCDFGLAATVGKEGLRDRVGSPDTVAPEVVLGLPYSFPADIWSVGAVAYMLLSARAPFHAGSDDGVLAKVCEGRYTLKGAAWASATDESKAFVAALMVTEISMRPTADLALRHRWLQARR